MTIGRICCREVDTASPSESARVAGQRMGARGVGTLVVVDQQRRPIGVLSDRDLAVRVVGEGRDAGRLPLSEIMTRDVHTVFEAMPIERALTLMRTQAVRRLVVVDADGVLVGIVSLDDVLGLIATEFREIGQLLQREDPRAIGASG